MSHHHHHPHSHESCGSCCHDHVCEDTCQTGHHEHEECDFPEQLLALADEAWMEVLKEKIKAKIESHSGKKLDQLASLVAQSNQARWKNRMGEKHVSREFKQKLVEFFSHE